MANVTVTRNYWVDWICAFDRYPTQKEIAKHKKWLIDYIKKYLSTGKTRAIQEFERWDIKQNQWVPINPLGSKAIRGLDPEDGAFIKWAMNTPSSYWEKILKIEWEQLGPRPMVFAFRAYFEDDDRRYTETRSTLNPPTPPPPPGSNPP